MLKIHLFSFHPHFARVNKVLQVLQDLMVSLETLAPLAQLDHRELMGEGETRATLVLLGHLDHL